MTRVFGPFIPEPTLSKITDDFSEWASFKLMLPRPIYRLFFTPVMPEIDALRMLQKMTVDALRDAPDIASDKPGASNPPTKPN
jgi:hypothetical protein